MITNKEIVDNLHNEINDLEKIIKKRNIYNYRNKVIDLVLTSAIAIDNILPLLLGNQLTYILLSKTGNTPFRYDTITEYANIKTIDTSTNYHQELASFDENYQDNTLESSTAWYKLNNGLYERIIAEYEVDIDSLDINDIFEKTPEELQKLFTITNIKTIQKEKLTEDDLIFDEPTIIITKSTKSKELKQERAETNSEFFGEIFIFTLIAIVFDYSLDKLKKIYIKDYFSSKLYKVKEKYRRINESEIVKIKKLIEIKKANYTLLTSNEPPKVYEYKLRKDGD